MLLVPITAQYTELVSRVQRVLIKMKTVARNAKPASLDILLAPVGQNRHKTASILQVSHFKELYSLYDQELMTMK